MIRSILITVHRNTGNIEIHTAEFNSRGLLSFVADFLRLGERQTSSALYACAVLMANTEDPNGAILAEAFDMDGKNELTNLYIIKADRTQHVLTEG